MARSIILARHGHHQEVGRVLSGRSDISLDRQGRVEAEALAGLVASRGVTRIVSSPRARTRETAAVVAAALALPVEIAAELDEVDFGDFTGRAFAALDRDADWQRWNAERATARCPDGETMGEAVARAVGFVAGCGEGVTLCVSHCDVIRGVVAHYLGLPLDRIFSLGCDPGSVTTLSLQGEGAVVVALNERSA
ncbi:histidine phosphatase family protein [Sphingomonas endophytica]|uniref:histidine phosphatase family protein n=1 Tax=Sphingomonas endophytica TaxID=869719 RepID=UPI00161B7CE5|nr:histidine phosphatase family protein [Sphingomonas endophytica]